MKNARVYLRLGAAIASAALFVYLLRRTGPDAILQNIRVLGWGLVVVIVLSGIRHFLRALAWSYCIDDDGSRPGTLQLFGARLVGEALSDLTPAGPLLGEPAKAVAISRLIPAEAAASSVILENLIYVLGAVFFVLAGIVVAFFLVSDLRGFAWVGGALALCAGSCVVVAYWTFRRKQYLLGTLPDSLKRVGWLGTFLERNERSIRAVDQIICAFFLNRRRTFLWVLAIEAVTNLTGIAEAYFILSSTAVHASLLGAFLVESAGRAVQFMFSFVPLGLGVQEGAAVVTLRAVGYAASEGVSLSLIRKMRSLFWAVAGVFVAARYSMASPAAERSTT
jgi:uncharacterized membrane protein YbhN (UPF0104 family)